MAANPLADRGNRGLARGRAGGDRGSGTAVQRSETRSVGHPDRRNHYAIGYTLAGERYAYSPATGAVTYGLAYLVTYPTTYTRFDCITEPHSYANVSAARGDGDAHSDTDSAEYRQRRAEA